MDQPISVLLGDLKERSMLKDPLVIWGGKFGRTRLSKTGNGRDDNLFGFTMWMAGGDVQGRQTIGSTDDLGLWAVSDKAHLQDSHSFILHAIGLDHMVLEFKTGGRLERPTINTGNVIRELIA